MTTASVTSAIAKASAFIRANNRQSAAPYLQEAAAAGHPDSMIMLAQWHADGAVLPYDPVRAAELAKVAADKDAAFGWFFHAQYLDQGFGQPENPAAARHALVAAAKLGFAPAWTQIGILLSTGTRDVKPAMAFLANAAAMGEPMAAALLRQMGEQLRQADRPSLEEVLATLLDQQAATPEPEILLDTPRIWRARGVFNMLEALYLVHLGAPHLQPSTVIDPVTGDATQHPTRKAYATHFGPNFEDLVAGRLNRLIATATGTTRAQAEPLALLRYQPGGEYKPHMDSFESGQQPTTGTRWDTAGQRILTALLYLNDGYGGGETEFSRIGLTIKGQMGDLLVFANVQADGTPDKLSLHAGKPVTQGQKWLGSRWIRAHGPTAA